MDLESPTKDITRSAEVGGGGSIFARKRRRRVSFADTTSVHFFDRDEDVDTPPDAKVGAESSSSQTGRKGDTISSREDESMDDYDDKDASGEHEFFVGREAESCSPCSTAASEASVDDDDLFGPVSLSFIRSGGSSKTTDDNNHDITLDSTAFSMHFNNIIPSDDRTINSFRSPRTPSELSMMNDSQALLLHGNLEKTGPSSECRKANGYSSDMTVVEKLSKNYDYEKLSLSLEGLYTKAMKPMEAQSLDLDEMPFSGHKYHDEISRGEVNAFESSGLLEAPQKDGTYPKGGRDTFEDELHVSNDFRTPNTCMPCTPIDEIDHGSQVLAHTDKGNGAQKQKRASSLSAETFKTKIITSLNAKSPRGSISESRFIHKNLERALHTKVSSAVITDSPSQIPTNFHEILHTPTQHQNTDRSMTTPETSVSSLRARTRQLLNDVTASLESGRQSKLSLKKKIIPDIKGASLVKNRMVAFETSEIDERDDQLSSQKSIPLDECKKSRKHLDFSTDMEVNHETSGNKYISPRNVNSSTCEKENIPTSGKRDHAIEMGPIFEPELPSNNNRSETIDNLTQKNAFSPASGYSRDKMQENSHGVRPVRKLFSPSKIILRQNLSAQKEEYFNGSDNQSGKSDTLVDEPKSETPRVYSLRISSRMEIDDAGKERSSSGITSYSGNRDTSHKAIEDIGIILKPSDDQSHIIPSSDIQEYVSCSDNQLVNSDTLVDKLKPETPKSYSLRSSSRMEVDDARKERSIRKIISYSGNQGVKHKPMKDIDSISKPLADRSHTISTLNVQEMATTSKQPEDVSRARSDQVTENNTSYDMRTNTSEKNVSSPMQLSSSLESRDHNPVSILEKLDRVLGHTRLAFSELTCKLNLQEIDALDDLICQLNNARKYETLYSHIQALRKNINLDQQKRSSEIRGIKETLLYEQARLQLRRSKHDRLLTKAQGLKSKIYEINELKQSLAKLVEKQSNLIPSVSQEENDRVRSKRKKLAEMEEKIKALVTFFATHCSISGTPSPDKVIDVVRRHFSELDDSRATCERLQLWKLASVANQTDQCDIALNYRDFLHHQFTITFTPASRFGIELSINDTVVETRFPNMRASIAFHFALRSLEGNRRLAGIKSFQSEIQACSFLLGNLLDVLEEIQSAQLQIPTLMSSIFSLTSDGKLDLQLHFVDLQTGGKLALSVDLTHLKCAVYPSEPYELQWGISCSSQMSTEKVNAAVRSLKCGRSTLLRLCCLMSQLMQAYSLSS